MPSRCARVSEEVRRCSTTERVQHTCSPCRSKSTTEFRLVDEPHHGSHRFHRCQAVSTQDPFPVRAAEWAPEAETRRLRQPPPFPF